MRVYTIATNITLRKKKDIDTACKLFIKKKPDSLVSVLKLKHIYNPESLYIFKKTKY